MKLPTLDGLDVSGKTIIYRADLNAPMTEGVLTDTTRLERVMPHIANLADAGARVVVISHFARPKGKVNEAMSLAPVGTELMRLMKRPVKFIKTDWLDDAPMLAITGEIQGTVFLAENIRFHPGEEYNDRLLAQKIAALGDLYVNDAFSACHRAHASIAAITEFIPSFAGQTLMDEVSSLSRGLDNPERPVVAIIGGAKISTKLALLDSLLDKVDRLLIGGAMANTFLAARGMDVGSSLHERDFIALAKNIIARADDKLVLPIDVTIGTEFKRETNVTSHLLDDLPNAGMILDLGPESISLFKQKIDNGATVVWNGPLGAFELPPFDQATNEIARHIAARTADKLLYSVVGGGDTIAALRHVGVFDDISYVSSAGGAFLEWLEGRQLPGLLALQRDTNKFIS